MRTPETGDRRARIPSAVRIDSGVLLSGPMIDVVAYAVKVAQRHRRQLCLPDLAQLGRLMELLAPVSERGQAATENDPTEQAEGMTIQEVAEALRCSVRTARRYARELGGRKAGGIWLIDRQAVLEHIDGKIA